MNKTTGGSMNSIVPHSAAAETIRDEKQISNASLATKKDETQEGELKILFPWTLHSLLQDAEKEGFDSTISWRPSGMAFKVHNREEFMTQVLPRYFRQTKFKSFVRQLNLWGFSCIDHEPDKGSYHHKAFVRGNADMCKGMRRTKIKRACHPSKPEAAANFAAHSTIGSTVATSTTYSPSLNMRPSFTDLPPLTGAYSVNHNADSSSLGESFYLPGGTIEQHATVSPKQLIERAYAQQQAATATQNTTRNNLLGRPRRQSGDWLDKLEAAICPTAPPSTPLGSTDTLSWMRLLEPRPIRPARDGTLWDLS